MKNKYLFLAVLFIASNLVVSCTTTQGPSPEPANIRLHGVEVVSQTNGGRVFSESYKFTYMPNNRVASFIYTTNDTSYPTSIVKFVYVDSTSKIYKTYYAYDDSIVLRLDSFLFNGSQQIIQEWTPLAKNTFTYNGKLLAYLTDSTFATTVYHAHEGDFYSSSSTISYDSSQSFYFDKTKNNRLGDYLQLRSFLVFGQNIYQNSHLVNQIKNSGYTTNIVYAIDAYSKITQTNAVVTDSVGNVFSYTYNLSYENF